MAKIKHFFRNEKVYDEINDRGVKFKDWVNENVEHFCCSECGAEVSGSNKFCSNCGSKFTGLKEDKVTCSCEICGSKFKQMSHETNTCCMSCKRIVNSKYGVDLAKAFYKLGQKSNQKE